ncbi:MAG: hypothetical protein WD401_06945, partial [Thermomicrobiaceae bacterium]
MNTQQLMSRIARFCADRRGLVLTGFALMTAALAIPFLVGAPDEMASDEPEGPIFEARDAIDTRFDGGVVDYDFIVESPSGNLLDREGLTAVSERLEHLRSDPEIGPVLASESDDQLGTRAGAVTIADRVVDALGQSPEQAGDDAWQEAASQIVDLT